MTENAPAGAIWLDSLDTGEVRQDYGTPGRGVSVDGHAITINGSVYKHGIGTHANSAILINLGGQATSFVSVVGVDDERGQNYSGSKASIQAVVKEDGRVVQRTPVLTPAMSSQFISLNLTGVKRLELDITDAGDGNTDDHADWAGAALTMQPGSTVTPSIIDPAPVQDSPARLTIPADSPIPVIHGAKVVGATPGRPFLYLIPATGIRPMTFTAAHLPAGLSLDGKTGIIAGNIRQPGTTVAILKAKNADGVSTRTLTFIAGDHMLAQTPPMGWNSWNVFAGNVDEGKVKAAAASMVASGLSEHGYQYINIDDTWEAGRDSSGNIQSNSKFPDMSALTAYVHSMGLRIGIYSSPGPTTCAGFTASYQHEQQDADSYARWGFDYLKYDWCSYNQIAAGATTLPALQKPYAVMRDALDHASRDIVYSLCQYGSGDVWTWGAKSGIGGNCWRTTGDIQDNWRSLHGIYESQDGHQVYAGPGHWNDPDMLVVGYVGWGNPHPPHLKQNEQILHITMWSMLSAPLLIGCDMTRLDAFTRALLTNDEVIDIDQDALGKPAGKTATDAQGCEIWSRPLAGGAHAAALLNPNQTPMTVAVAWKQLGLSGPQSVRDLWLHKNLGRLAAGYSVTVPAHGAVLLRLDPQR